MGLTEKQKRALVYLSKGGRFFYNGSNTWWHKDGPFDRRVMAALHKKRLITVYSFSTNGENQNVLSFGLSQLGKEVLGLTPDHPNRVSGFGLLPNVSGSHGIAPVDKGFREKVQNTLSTLESTESLTKGELLALKIARRALGQISHLAFRVAVQAAKEEL